MILRFTILGAPRTKKNHGRIVHAGGRPRIMPSAAFKEWNSCAQVQLVGLRQRGLKPIAEPISVAALFYRDAERGDAVGYYQALADALEEGRIVENDAWIVNWDGSRLLKDAKNPRIEVAVEYMMRNP